MANRQLATLAVKVVAQKVSDGSSSNLYERAALASDAERVHLGERWIERYCQEEAGNRKLVLRRLLNAIHKEAQQYPSEGFWITMQAYVQSLLSKLEPEEPLPPPEG